jgi:type I restriction enzyme R subunit
VRHSHLARGFTQAWIAAQQMPTAPEQPARVPTADAASSCLLALEESQVPAHFFDPQAPLNITRANLPHWQQNEATCFTTFRLIDSLPREKLELWANDREAWLHSHPEPVSEDDWREYHEKFSATIERWLDQGSGSCLLEMPECREIVESALRYFDGQRYQLGDFVVASNHVHALVTPLSGHDISNILQSWKSFTAKELIKVEAASRRLQPWWDELHARRQAAAFEQSPARYAALQFQRPVWQKESFDHIVRSPASLKKFEDYIRDHKESGSGIPPLAGPSLQVPPSSTNPSGKMPLPLPHAPAPPHPALPRLPARRPG